MTNFIVITFGVFTLVFLFQIYSKMIEMNDAINKRILKEKEESKMTWHNLNIKKDK
jgi:hypothetical protein